MPKPVINEDRCTSCNICTEICPVEVFEKVDGIVVVKKHQECIGCRACEAQCPKSALIVED